MKALLVYPGEINYDFAEYFFPVGLLYIDKALEQIGVEAVVWDLRIKRLEDVPRHDYLFVGFSLMTAGNMVSRFIESVKWVRHEFPSAPIIVGGPHPTALPMQTLESPLVDFVCVSEGDVTVKEFALELMNHREWGCVRGLGWKHEGKAFVNASRPFVDMNQLDYRLNYGKIGHPEPSKVAFTLNTSRGCPHRCGFCQNQVSDKRKYRTRSAEKTLEEIEWVQSTYHTEAIGFGSEYEFFIDLGRVRKIARGIIERKLKVAFNGCCRFDTLDRMTDDDLVLFKRAGLDVIQCGAESGSSAMLELMQKDITLKQIRDGLEKAERHGIRVLLSAMCGFPGETREDIEATLRLMEEVTQRHPLVSLGGIFSWFPLPATPLWDRAIERGFKPPERLEDWTDYNLNDLPAKYRAWRGGHDALCRGVSLVARTPAYRTFWDREDYLVQKRQTMNYHREGWFYYLFTRIQQVRWKLRWFGWLWEHRVFDAAVRVWGWWRKA